MLGQAHACFAIFKESPQPSQDCPKRDIKVTPVEHRPFLRVELECGTSVTVFLLFPSAWCCCDTVCPECPGMTWSVLIQCVLSVLV